MLKIYCVTNEQEKMANKRKCDNYDLEKKYYVDDSSDCGSDFIESDEDYRSCVNYKRFKGTSDTEPATKTTKIQRNPTRRPNLKITNRNAVMARLNRQRKKEMMESMEHEINKVKEENYRLRKVLKLKSSKISHLENERNYLKNVLANKTEIMAILKSLPKLPTSSSLNCSQTVIKEERQNRAGSCTSTSTSLSLEADEFENGSCLLAHDPFLPDNTNDYLFTDYKSYADEWAGSPFSDTLIPDFPQTDLLEVKSEHNYCEDEPISLSSPSSAGVCVHINSGRVSLEFCAECHRNASSAWNPKVC